MESKMSEILPTVTIETENGTVRINESDYDAATMKLVGAEPVAPVAPVVPAPAPVAPVAPVVEKFVTKKGKGFIVVDKSGAPLDSTVYDSEDAAWASTLPTE